MGACSPPLLPATEALFYLGTRLLDSLPADPGSYTSKFPHEPLVGNVPTSSAIVWTGVSVIVLLASIGWLV
jgi:nitric oxide reductase subunit B